MFKKYVTSLVVMATVAVIGSQAQSIQGAPYAQMLKPYNDQSAEGRPNCEYFSWRRPACLEGAAPVSAVLEGVNFDFNKSSLRPESYAILDGNIAKLKANTKKVTVEGHTDNIGSDAYNDKLSNKRAKTVSDYFVSKGIDASRLTAVGKGESSPIASNDTEEGRFKNRRVELRAQ